MEISGLESIMATRSVAASFARQEQESQQVASRGTQGDTVSISSEAKRLYERFRDLQTESAGTNSQGSASSDSASNTANGQTAGDGKTDTVASGPSGSSGASGNAEAAGNTGGTGSGEGLAKQIENIKKQIKELQNRVKQIMDSPLPAEQKQTVAAPYLQQIQELEQQLQQLEADAAKQGSGDA
ncbi:FlxA-like family protein [Nitratidesulfovibrio vulgaris]|uniref:FlxA-like protein n=1 Tax=Nitratidesulfovibrio vulgaris (strain ATCC 29579 / DSM 644 / CCUG 34227 / NCIMB 8303 / VKM B-1760 / Hildenborough) TaxID=882 RepID=Q72A62_NITV2|nr:FlxA-like family protein [Nitratidesulfovibrio vulgaris]AAS96608.1 hypothetical protein DVU_2135 [Nitratidesulfovibrio vulgaris str. Hildenborough]ADP87132.1 hypothetical protein Deval_1984 [Nitratidesulfovibrio vulgaris RCH1]